MRILVFETYLLTFVLFFLFIFFFIALYNYSFFIARLTVHVSFTIMWMSFKIHNDQAGGDGGEEKLCLVRCYIKSHAEM